MINIEYPSTDPYFNLALEQHVFDRLDRSQDYFMLWQNDNAVIVGKHQNTIEEINAAFVAERGIRVARRLSGGGAVYHDLGNLNFTFIRAAGDSSQLDFHLFCEPVTNALKAVGVKAEINGRNDITIDGRKFSGNSQYIKQGRVMHHGTIMFDSDLEMVSRALRVSGDKIESKGVKSIRSRVTNVAEHLKSPVTIEEFREVLRKRILGEARSDYVLTEADIAAVTKLRDEQYATWDWNYGASPDYAIRKKRRIEGCGTVEVCLRVDDGLITDLRFFGDFFGAEDAGDLAALFIGQKPRKSSYETLLADIRVGRYINNLNNSQLIEILLQ